MELVKKYLPTMIVALLVIVAYDFYKSKRAEKLAASSSEGAAA